QYRGYRSATSRNESLTWRAIGYLVHYVGIHPRYPPLVRSSEIPHSASALVIQVDHRHAAHPGYAPRSSLIYRIQAFAATDYVTDTIDRYARIPAVATSDAGCNDS